MIGRQLGFRIDNRLGPTPQQFGTARNQCLGKTVETFHKIVVELHQDLTSCHDHMLTHMLTHMPIGGTSSGPARPCALHEAWAPLMERTVATFSKMTLSDLDPRVR